MVGLEPEPGGHVAVEVGVFLDTAVVLLAGRVEKLAEKTSQVQVTRKWKPRFPNRSASTR